MLEATLDERYGYALLVEQWAWTPWIDRSLLGTRPFCGYGVTVIWQDGVVCDWHADSLPDVTGIAEVRPGVLSMLYALE
jgi:hypothetical protein